VEVDDCALFCFFLLRLKSQVLGFVRVEVGDEFEGIEPGDDDDEEDEGATLDPQAFPVSNSAWFKHGFSGEFGSFPVVVLAVGVG